MPVWKKYYETVIVLIYYVSDRENSAYLNCPVDESEATVIVLKLISVFM